MTENQLNKTKKENQTKFKELCKVEQLHMIQIDDITDDILVFPAASLSHLFSPLLVHNLWSNTSYGFQSNIFHNTDTTGENSTAVKNKLTMNSFPLKSLKTLSLLGAIYLISNILYINSHTSSIPVTISKRWSELCQEHQKLNSFTPFPSLNTYSTNTIPQIIIRPKSMEFMEHIAFFFLS